MGNDSTCLSREPDDILRSDFDLWTWDDMAIVLSNLVDLFMVSPSLVKRQIIMWNAPIFSAFNGATSPDLVQERDGSSAGKVGQMFSTWLQLIAHRNFNPYILSLHLVIYILLYLVTFVSSPLGIKRCETGLADHWLLRLLRSQEKAPQSWS